MGDILKIASWPMSFVLAAMARRKLFFTTQISWNAVYLLLVFFGLPLFGLQITGIAFFVLLAGHRFELFHYSQNQQIPLCQI